MQIFELNGLRIETESDFHVLVSSALGFFEGYGRNLDALYDVLTDDSGLMSAKKPFKIVWNYSNNSKGKLKRFDEIVKVFQDAADETGSIELELK